MNKKAISVLIFPLLILTFRPLNVDLNQAIILSTLMITIISWIVGKPNKIISSIFLLIMFILFGNTPIRTILSFPLSSNFLMIVFSFIFSQGIINSNLAKKLFLPFINRYSRNGIQFLITMVISVIILVSVIPQPYSRVILLAMVYQEFFNSISLEEATREVLIFSIFAFNILAHLLFKRGDIVLNNGILAVANVQMSELEWMKNLLVPGLGMLVLAMIFFVFAFKKELKLFKPGEISITKIELNKDDKINLALILIIIVLWATESIHNVSGTTVLIVGTIIMYFRKIIGFKDLKSVNVEVLVFLTAAFSIGSVMAGSGIADKIFGRFTELLPNEFNFLFVLTIVSSTMVLRMFLGSTITTMSVAIPSFISMAEGKINSTIIMFLVFLSLLTVYLLPFHNSLLAVGEGNNYFSNKTVLRFGVYCIILTFISIFLFFIPWWRFIGLM
ncbi:MAG: hypothetical protein GX053_06310 [Tissierella sp.]|nr:hypothetical protein [Tissierella sp.]